ncbi:hypothetical protein MHBO_000748 [Bonamia ostreae]|uniref:Uncharacterized protein n=1 Tax=Bonamia ostreae TaxID=126728 RepID=A0ABV2AGW4_9EUKA
MSLVFYFVFATIAKSFIAEECDVPNPAFVSTRTTGNGSKITKKKVGTGYYFVETISYFDLIHIDDSLVRKSRVSCDVSGQWNFLLVNFSSELSKQDIFSPDSFIRNNRTFKVKYPASIYDYNSHDYCLILLPRNSFLVAPKTGMFETTSGRVAYLGKSSFIGKCYPGYVVKNTDARIVSFSIECNKGEPDKVVECVWKKNIKYRLPKGEFWNQSFILTLLTLDAFGFLFGFSYRIFLAT